MLRQRADCSSSSIGVSPHKATNKGLWGCFKLHSWLCAEKRQPAALVSKLIKKPRGTYAPAARCRDPVSQHPVGGDHCDVASVPDIDLRPDRLDDRVISRLRGVDGPQAAILPSRNTLLGDAFKDQDDLVTRKLRGHQALVQATGGACAIPPPPIGATAHNVRAIDDQDLHSDSVGLGWPS
jgi:hypothetical protein